MLGIMLGIGYAVKRPSNWLRVHNPEEKRNENYNLYIVYITLY